MNDVLTKDHPLAWPSRQRGGGLQRRRIVADDPSQSVS